jgi:trypsin
MVLTAAHCQGGSYNVVIGRHSLNSNSGESIPMQSETPHPKYDDRTTDSDWMLVKLERSTTQNVPFIKLNNDGNSPQVGQEVTVMGWGDMTSDDMTQELADVLMSVDVNVISNSDCDASKGSINGWSDSYNGQITSNMLCAADKGQDSCQGDSGGPLVIQGKSGDGSDDVQVGVVSWGVGCASPDFPGVYSRLSEAYDWIVSEVCSQSSNPPAELCGGSSGSIAAFDVADDDGSYQNDGGSVLDDGTQDDYTSSSVDDYSDDAPLSNDDTSSGGDDFWNSYYDDDFWNSYYDDWSYTDNSSGANHGDHDDHLDANDDNSSGGSKGDDYWGSYDDDFDWSSYYYDDWSDDNAGGGTQDDTLPSYQYDDDFWSTYYDDWSYPSGGKGDDFAHEYDDDYYNYGSSSFKADSANSFAQNIFKPAKVEANANNDNPSEKNWVKIIEDDFNSDLGFFNSGGKNAKWMKEKKGRSGVLDIQDDKDESSSVYSNTIKDTSYSSYRVVFSAYLLGMEDDNKFCFDISTDGGSGWDEVTCWSTKDLPTKTWHDNVAAEFEASASELTLRFRCRGANKKDDVFIDKVTFEGS